MKNRNETSVLAFLFFFLTLASWTFHDARAEDSYAPKSRALIVGVSEYKDKERFRSLPWVEEDVNRVEAAFKELGFETTTVSNKRGFPTLTNVKTYIEKICKETKKDDVLALYFSVHGFASGSTQSDSQESFLAFQDSKWDAVASEPDFKTCLSARWIREQTSGLPSKKVLILFDACSSGGARVSYADSFPNNCVNLEDGADVATFASCRAFEKSERIKINGQVISFFTYWLLQGLGGFADENLDGTTTTDELFGSIADNVEYCRKINEKSPSKKIPVSQFPVIVHCSKPGSISGEPFELLKTVETIPSKDVVDRFADQIVSYCDLISVFHECKVRIDEKNFQGDDKISFDFTGYATEEKVRIEDELKFFITWLPAELKKALRVKGKDLELNIDTEVQEREADVLLSAIVDLKKIDDLPCYAITFKIKFPKIDEQTIILKSLIKKTEGKDDPKPKTGLIDDPSKPPITDACVLPSVLFSVLTPDGKRVVREPFICNGATWVELNAGETFGIKVDASKATNRDSYVGMKLLVDGVDTLNPKPSFISKQIPLFYREGDEEKAPSKDLFPLPANDDWKTSLVDAGVWAVNVNSQCTIKGFQHKKGSEGTAYEFKVEKLDQNGTEYQNDIYNDSDIGLITFCFVELEKSGGTRNPEDVVVVPGPEISSPTTKVPYRATDVIYGTKRIRYASSEKMRQLGVRVENPVAH